MMRVLVYQIGQLGDTIVSVPALRAVRHYFGETARIHLLHDATHQLVTSEMVLEGSGLIDEFIPYSPEKGIANKLRVVAKLWRCLKRGHFDAVVSVLPSDRSRWALLRDSLFFRACGISWLIGFQPYQKSVFQPRNASGRPAKTPSEAILRLRRLFAEGLGPANGDHFAVPLLAVSQERQSAADDWLKRQRKYPNRPLVALCPGCKKPGNAWPAERFLDIARRLLNLDLCELVILGGPAERGLADFLMAKLEGRAIHAAGCFSVSESAALLARCSLLIGLDTGTTHLAAAVGVPCVVLQSANSFPGHWDPLGENHVVLRAAVPCEGCLLQECPVEGHPCMRNITVDIAWEAIQRAVSTLGLGRAAELSAAAQS
jgi:ADP-heptose:LPS heptosyltransferase